MDFEKKYPITQRLNEYLLVQWTRGYRQVDVYHNDQLIGSVQGAGKLQQGTSFLSDLGPITLKLSEKPVTLDVIVDRYHSPVNVSHPFKELKKSAVFFWMITAFAIVGALLDGMSIGIGGLGQVVVSFNVILIGLYITSSICVSKGMAWAFYMGFCLYCLITFFSLLTLPVSGVFGIVGFLIRILMVVFLSINMKYANQTLRHKKFDTSVINSDLLDS
jgi:hypothetical protein